MNNTTDIAKAVFEIKAKEKCSLEDISDLSALFSDADMDACDSLIDNVRKALAEALDIDSIKSFDRHLMTPEALEILLLSPNIEDQFILGRYALVDQEAKMSYVFEITQILLANGETCFFAVITKRSDKTE